MRINIPASIEDATERLTGIESLLTAQRWERAAIVAAFVRLGTRNNEGGNLAMAQGSMSPVQFAALNINGLKSNSTVQTYVNRWLEANEGVYPSPGDAVFLPDDSEWEGTRTGTNGHNSTAGVQNTIAAMIETHGAEAVAEAISVAAPEVGREAYLRTIPERPLPAGTTVVPNEHAIDDLLEAQGLLGKLGHAITLIQMHRVNHPAPWIANAEDWADRLRRMETEVGMLASAVAGITDADMDALLNEGSA